MLHRSFTKLEGLFLTYIQSFLPSFRLLQVPIFRHSIFSKKSKRKVSVTFLEYTITNITPTFLTRSREIILHLLTMNLLKHHPILNVCNLFLLSYIHIHIHIHMFHLFLGSLYVAVNMIKHLVSKFYINL